MTDNGSDRSPANLYDVLARARANLGELGLRDRHKVDKLERIAEAAHKLFARDGYERTTLRDIASEAGVALGTLSLYARDKRDLIMLIFNRLIPPLLEQGFARALETSPLADSMLAFFEPFYQAFARNVTLYRIVLGQIYGGPTSVHAAENGIIRSGLIGHLQCLLRRAIDSGECDCGIDLPMQARSFYYLYFAAVRVWLSQDEPAPKRGLLELRVLFEQHVTGLRAGTLVVSTKPKAAPALPAARRPSAHAR